MCHGTTTKLGDLGLLLLSERPSPNFPVAVVHFHSPCPWTRRLRGDGAAMRVSQLDLAVLVLGGYDTDIGMSLKVEIAVPPNASGHTTVFIGSVVCRWVARCSTFPPDESEVGAVHETGCWHGDSHS